MLEGQKSSRCVERAAGAHVSLRTGQHFLVEVPVRASVHEGVDVSREDSGERRSYFDALEDDLEGSGQRGGHEHALRCRGSTAAGAA